MLRHRHLRQIIGKWVEHHLEYCYAARPVVNLNPEEMDAFIGLFEKESTGRTNQMREMTRQCYNCAILLGQDS